MWDVAKDLVSGKNEFEGTFVIPEPIIDSIKTHASESPNKETGGMLFGRIDTTETGLDITVDVVHNVSENKASNTSTYFGIDPAYATEILHEYEPEHLYLGNWHSHLGYGGPSAGDRQEVGKFFQENEGRDVTLDFIIDRQSRTELSYKLIIDVYRRKKDHASEYETLRVGGEDIEFPEVDEKSVTITNSTELDIGVSSGESTSSVTASDDGHAGRLARFLCETYDLDRDDIRIYRSEPFDETVTLAPFEYEREQHGDTLQVMLKVSFPDDSSEDVFIDLTSPTLEKQLTIEKLPADMIGEGGSVLTDRVIETLEEDIPRLLDDPLSSVLSDTDSGTVATNTGWKLCQN